MCRGIAIGYVRLDCTLSMLECGLDAVEKGIEPTQQTSQTYKPLEPCLSGRYVNQEPDTYCSVCANCFSLSPSGKVEDAGGAIIKAASHEPTVGKTCWDRLNWRSPQAEGTVLGTRRAQVTMQLQMAFFFVVLLRISCECKLSGKSWQ